MFLASAFLWGLAAVSLPVIIHMMQSPRARLIDFPCVRFLKACQRRAVRRTRLKNIILMLMRVALIALIALGMAKPWRETERTTVLPDAPVSMVLVLDNSYSMGYLDKGSSRFEQAKQAAFGLVDSLKPGDEVAVVLMNEQAVPYVREFTTDRERVKRAIREAELSMLGTNVDPALRDAIRMVDKAGTGEPNERRSREIHILTDLQAYSWDPILSSNFLKTVDTKASLFVASFGRRGSPNNFIESANIAGSGSDECTITAQVRADGAGSPGNIVTLNVNGKNVTQETFAVRPGQPASVPLVTKFAQPGTYRCILSLQDDGLTIDDKYHFTVDVGERSSVLVVDGDPSGVSSLSETFYLAAALNPGGVAGDGGASPMNAYIVPVSEFRTAKFENLRCVILCNVAALDGADLLKLENFLREGGSMLIFLGAKVIPEQYNQWTFLPISLTKIVGDPSRKASFAFGEVRGDHAVFARKIDLRSARFFFCFGSDRNTLKKDANVLAGFDNGEAAVVEGRFGRGKVLLFTSTCDLEWSNFALRRAFLPWVYQVIYYLSNQDTKGKAFRLNEKVVFQALAAEYKKTITVTDPLGRKVTLPPQVKGGYAEAVYTGTGVPGMYQVEAEPGFSNSGGFGVNLDVKESVIAMAAPEKITASAPAGMVTFLDAPGRNVADEIKRTREGDDLWPSLFQAAVVVFLVESLFGNLVSRARQPGGLKMPLFEVLKQRNPGVVQ